MKVKDISIKEVYYTTPDTNINEAASMMKRHGVGILPVCEGGRLLGMLTDRDIVIGCVAAGMDTKDCQVREFMTSDVVKLNPDMNIEEAAEIMGKEQVRRLPVVEDGCLRGMISLGDISLASENDIIVAETLRDISKPAQVASF
jgi:CBS domain-containing protein